ncbi:MAG: hypothetical protein HDS48_05360 [Bacteroides sp.]|nr:hypothetical protein [Bacteroides sp.]
MALLKRSYAFTVVALFLLLSLCTGCRESPDERIRKDVAAAQDLIEQGDNERALELLLEAQARLDESVSPGTRIALYTAFVDPYYNSYSHRFGRAQSYALRAVETAREADSLQWLPVLLWNLVINTQDMDSASMYLRECRDLSDRYGEAYMAARSRIFLAKIDWLSGDRERAERIFDSISVRGQMENLPLLHLELDIERAGLYNNSGENEKALSLLQTIDRDSLSLDGRISLYWMLDNISRKEGRWEAALTYSDSLAICRDSIQRLTSSMHLEQVEGNYSRKLMQKEERQSRFLWLSGAAFLILLIVIFFLNRDRSLRRHQMKLIADIAELNVKLREAERDEVSEQMDLLSPLMEKLRLTKEFYFTLPVASLVAQLNMMPNPDDIPKEKLKELTESVVGTFSEISVDLRHTEPALTQDDSLFCLLCYVGISKDVAGAIMKSSEDALRKRKSRIKQKISSDDLFNLIFSK